MRLGFAVKPLAQPELRSHDTRRWQSSPDLSVSLAYLRDVFRYLVDAKIGMYRLSSELAPYATHPDLPQFHNQVAECKVELARLGEMADDAGLRLSFHLAPHVVLNTPDPDLAMRSRADVEVLTSILDLMDLGPNAVIVTHVGGIYGDLSTSRARFVEGYLALPRNAQRRLVLENDDARYAVSDVLWVHERTGLRLVFDNLHHRLNNRDGLSVREALAACLATWPDDIRPKVHFSSPRTEWLVEEGRAGDEPTVRRTKWAYHSDYVHPFEFIDFCHAAAGLRQFDVMIEARAKDLALCQLRRDLAQFAPGLAAQLEPSSHETTA